MTQEAESAESVNKVRYDLLPMTKQPHGLPTTHKPQLQAQTSSSSRKESTTCFGGSPGGTYIACQLSRALSLRGMDPIRASR